MFLNCSVICDVHHVRSSILGQNSMFRHSMFEVRYFDVHSKTSKNSCQFVTQIQTRNRFNQPLRFYNNTSTTTISFMLFGYMKFQIVRLGEFFFAKFALVFDSLMNRPYMIIHAFLMSIRFRTKFTLVFS